MLITFYIATFIILFLISLWDYETETIPHHLTIILLILGIINVILFANDWKAPIIGFFAFFALFSILFFLGFMGGGDVKILSIFALFLLGNEDKYSLIFNFSVIFMVALMLGGFHLLINKNKALRLGPYMCFSLIGTYVFNLFTNYYALILCALYFCILLFFADAIIMRKKVVTNEKIFIINKK